MAVLFSAIVSSSRNQHDGWELPHLIVERGRLHCQQKTGMLKRLPLGELALVGIWKHVITHDGSQIMACGHELAEGSPRCAK